MIYKYIGMFSVFSAVVLLVLLIAFGVLGIILIKRKKVIMPRLLLFMVDNLYFPLKSITHFFGINDLIVDRVGVEARNFSEEARFKNVDPKKRMLLLPHCLRHLKCPAKLSPIGGIDCKECGLCIIKELKTRSEDLGYEVVIAPGSGFVKRKIKAMNPEGALCVACYKDLNHVMQSISRKKIPVMGVPLTKDGCVETSVDSKRILEIIDMHQGNTLNPHA
jgi:hypothetical protein